MHRIGVIKIPRFMLTIGVGVVQPLCGASVSASYILSHNMTRKINTNHEIVIPIHLI